MSRSQLPGLVLVLLTSSALLPALSAAAENRDVAADLVVQIESTWPDGPEGGSGILVGEQYGHLFVLTANHVVRRGIDEASVVRVRFHFWRQEQVDAELMDVVHRDLDLALLRVKLDAAGIPREAAAALRAVADGGGSGLVRGDRVFPVGHPQGRSWFVPVDPQPVVEQVGGEFRFEYDCEGGYSGGGVFDAAWRLRGMVQRYDGKLCIGLGFPTIREVAEQGWGIPMNLVSAGPPGGPEAGPSAPAARARKDVVVAVLFEPPKRGDAAVAGMAQELVGSQLAGLRGVTLVERDRLDKVAVEQDFARVFGDDTDGASSFGGMLDADLLLLGTLGDARSERRAFSGYDIEGVADHYTATLGWRLVEVSSGRLLASGNVQPRYSERYPQAATAPAEPVDRTQELVRRGVDEAAGALRAAVQARSGG